MGQTEIKLFIILSGIVVTILIAGIILFIFQYRQRRMTYEKEKQKIEKQHKIDLLNAELASQQHTMQYIGEEIHDNVGQKLTLASLYVNQLIQQNKAEESTAKAVSIGKIIDDSLCELRKLSKTLTDPQENLEDIVALLQKEADDISLLGLCYVYVDSSEAAIPMPSGKKNSLFRIFQEFIQNSLKHSKCRTIKIKLEKNESGLLISASDDGTGFVPDEASKGIGLQTMKHRADKLNARYEFVSSPGKGTSLSLDLPIAEN
jgi:signal transduction histidine kinase